MAIGAGDGHAPALAAETEGIEPVVLVIVLQYIASFEIHAEIPDC